MLISPHIPFVGRDESTGGTGCQAGETRVRVLHVVPSLEVGGLEQIVLDLVRLGVEAGQKVDVLCIDRLGELAPAVAEAGGHVHCLHKPPGFWFTELKGLRDVLRMVRPDVIHTHATGELFYTGPVARRLGFTAIIHTEHGALYGESRQTRLVGRIAGRHAMKVVCVSHETARHVLGHRIVPKRKVKVIYNGVDLDRFDGARSERRAMRGELNIPESVRVIGTVGRLSTVKRQDVLIRAFARVRQAIPDCHLLLVGDGPTRGALTDLVASLHLGDQVHFTGYRVDRERCLAAIDLFALTSDSEGTPLSLLEAWATGLPAVVTSVGGLPELVENYVTGILVPPRNPEMLAAAMTEVLVSPRLYDSLAGASAETVRSRFDRRAMFERYTSEYLELLNHNPAKKESLRWLPRFNF